MTFSNFIGNFLEPFANATYLVAVLIYSRSHAWKTNKLLCIYYALATAFMLYASFMVGQKNGNIWIYNTTGSLAQVFIGLHFYYLLESRIKKNTVLIFISTYILYAAVKNLILQDVALFDSVGYSLVSASIGVIVFMYFHQLLKHVTEADILRQFNFWLASGYLIYFVGSFIIFVSYYYLTTKILTTYTQEERALLKSLWGMHNVLLFICALSLLIGSIWVTYRRRSA